MSNAPSLDQRPTRHPVLSRQYPPLFLGLIVGLLGVVLRFTLVWEQDLEPRGIDLLGVMSDLGVGALVAILVVSLHRVNRVLSGVVAMFWVALSFASFEYVKTFGAVESFRHLGYVKDPTFFKGSFTQMAHPVFLVVMVLVVLGLAIYRLPGQGWWRSKTSWRVGLGTSLLGVVMLLVSVVAFNEENTSWRVLNFLPANAIAIVQESESLPAAEEPSNKTSQTTKTSSKKRTNLAKIPEKISPRNRAIYDKIAADLSGKPRFENLPKKPNILLVLIEGVSGAHLPSIAKHHGISYETKMPHLDKLAKENVSYVNYVSTQRQTNRGLYAHLCGDLPKLDGSLAKMNEYQDGELRCAPRLLREAGYQTAYIQAAPLAFMYKDRFMEAAGFEHLYDTEHFKKSYFRNGWGVDDRTLYEGGVKILQDLEQKSPDAPWFATLLTVTTHHPYEVPEKFKFPGAKKPHQRAMAYADDSIKRLIDNLKAKGMLENTIVMLSSDESGGLIYGKLPDEVTRKISHNWGFVVMLLPPSIRKAMKITTPYSTPDTAISLLDLAGLQENKTHRFIGRSYLREEHAPRVLYSGSTYTGMVSKFEDGRGLIACNHRVSSCSLYERPKGQLFHAGDKKQPVNKPEVKQVRDMRQYSQQSAPKMGAGQKVSWTEKGPQKMIEYDQVDLVKTQQQQIIFGGQFLNAPKNTQIDTDLDFTVETDGQVDFMYFLSYNNRVFDHVKIPPMRNNDRSHISVRAKVPKSGLFNIRSRFAGRLLSGTYGRVKFKNATIELSTMKDVPKKEIRATLDYRFWGAPDNQPRTYSLKHPGHFSHSKCATRKKQKFFHGKCTSAYPLFGPYVWLQKGAKVKFTVDVESKKETSVYLDLASSYGSRVHKRGQTKRIFPSRRTQLVLEYEVTENIVRLESRVALDRKVADIKSLRGLVVHDATLEITPAPLEQVPNVPTPFPK